MKSQKTNSNEGKNPSQNVIYKQNPPPISTDSMKELITSKRKADQPKTGNLGSQKRAYQAGQTNSATKNNAPAGTNLTGSPREIISGRENDTDNVNISPMDALFTSSSKRIEKKQPNIEKPDLCYQNVPLIPCENITVNNSPSSIASSTAVRSCPQPNFDGLTKRVESEKQQAMEEEVLQDADVANLLEEDVKAFKSVSGFKDFKIIIHGTDITSDIKERTLFTYYSLCLAQNSYLHHHLMEGINLKDAAHYIGQTVTIWNQMTSSNLSQTSVNELRYWFTVLGSLLNYGMDVKFMMTRVKRLFDIKEKADKTVDKKRDEEAKAEGEALEEKIKAFELEIEKTREEKRRIDDERAGIRKNAEEFEAMFRLVATAPLD